ncbi:MAG: GDSL-type esterase/lipase family protein, partial [Erysipelotrichaceae bacterium]|nr:GDSL-type esterase/lipase family protein [Erysipelotrichaceae bacterium]
NTYGMNPLDGGRYDHHIRWTKVLQNILRNDYEIIEEGQNGRTTIYDDEKPNRNGIKDLIPCLNKHKPIDVVILMLGTNDLKTRFHASVQDIANNVSQLVDVIQKETSAKIILVSPMEVTRGIENGTFGDSFDASAVKRSQDFSKYYRIVAQEKNCIFVDAAMCSKPSDIDHLHMSEEAHYNLANELAKVIISL